MCFNVIIVVDISVFSVNVVCNDVVTVYENVVTITVIVVDFLFFVLFLNTKTCIKKNTYTPFFLQMCNFYQSLKM